MLLLSPAFMLVLTAADGNTYVGSLGTVWGSFSTDPSGAWGVSGAASSSRMTGEGVEGGTLRVALSSLRQPLVDLAAGCNSSVKSFRFMTSRSSDPWHSCWTPVHGCLETGLLAAWQAVLGLPLPSRQITFRCWIPWPQVTLHCK